ncbi:MAG: TlyA family RNA methyltransferase [Actinomycetota bacterium]
MNRRRLDAELVRRKLVGSRTEAKRAIEAGLVRVGTISSPKPSTLVAPDEPVHLLQPPEPFVSRAGRKLDRALELFNVDVDGLRVVDVGASTGGFTDCLLQRGASSVTAIDVGYGQMHWKVRNDDRVEVVERTNIRTADISQFGEPFDIVVSDLSFISLRAVHHQLALLGASNARWILLIKPQFEAGREAVGKGGIVRDPGTRRRVVIEVVESFSEIGLGCTGLIESPITGATGNVEYVAIFERGRGTVSSDTIDKVFDRDPQ